MEAGADESEDLAFTVPVAMRDGTELMTDVYLPEAVRSGRRRRAPVLLARVPYGRREQVACLPAIAAEMAARGYALVAQDIRGRYDSGGVAAPFAAHELTDAWDTLEWIRSRPWAQDGIVTVGDSYCGWLQWAAAAAGHPGLRAIVPGMTTTRVGQDWMHDGGSFCLHTMAEWAVVAWSGRVNRFLDLDWRGRPLGELVQTWLGDTPVARDFACWATSPPGSAYWRRGTFARVRAHRVATPALHVGGWWDIFRRGQLADWRAARRRRGDQYLVMSSTDHHHVPLRSEPWLGTRDEDDRRFAERYARLLDPFLAHVFRCRGAPEPAPVTYEIAHDGRREADRWPPPGVRRQSLHLVDGAHALSSCHGGGLAPRRSRQPARVSWVHDPADLVPAAEPDPFAVLMRPADQRLVERRDDVPSFSTPPLQDPLDLIGESRVVLRGAARPGRQFVARLCDVFPDGRAFGIAEGTRTVGPGDDPATTVVALAPTAYRLPPGHSLRLDLAGSSFPRYLPRGAGDAGRDLGERAEYELRIGGADGSRLELSALSSSRPRHGGGQPR